MKDWQETLDLLDRQGWNYKVSSFFDCGVGKNLFLLKASRGAVRVKARGQSLPEATVNLLEALKAPG